MPRVKLKLGRGPVRSTFLSTAVQVHSLDDKILLIERLSVEEGVEIDLRSVS